jgi:acetyltransferase
VLDSIFNPRSVLIVGVSPKRTNFAANIARNLALFAYPGEIVLLGREPGCLLGQRIRTSFDEVPEGIELAVILTPARAVPDVLEGCGRKGIRHAIVESGGFRELGEEGAALEDRLEEIAARHGIRFVGPNCLGVIAPAAGFAPVFVPLRDQWQPGNVSVAAQSGGVGMAYLVRMASECIGLRRFVSIGNKLCLDETDFVRSFTGDPETAVVALYLEGVTRGRAFFDALRACPKPVLVQKANRTALGQKIAFSHTASLAQDDAICAAALRQAGALRVDCTRDFIGHLKALQLPVMRGPRVAIISRSGGHAVIAADAAADNGLTLPEFPPRFLSSFGSTYTQAVIKRQNPLDLGDIFDFDLYAWVMDGTAALPDVDAVVMIHEYFSEFGAEASRRLVPKADEISKKYRKPVALVLYADDAEIAHLKKLYQLPFFTSVEETFTALAAKWRTETVRVTPDLTPPAPTAAAAARVRSLFDEGRRTLLAEALDVVRCAGLRTPPAVLVRGAEEVPAGLTFPVAAKVVAERLPHKTDAGAVVLGLADEAALRRAVGDLAARCGPFAAGEGVLVQGMAPPGVEVIVGAVRDPSFGPVVMLGLGGIFVEALRDTVLRLAPVSEVEAAAMCRELRGAALLGPVRGRPPADVPALARLIVTVAHLMAAAPEVAEVDLNPCIVHPAGQGVTVVDARIRLA